MTMGKRINVDDVIDATDVARIIGLTNAKGVSVYQQRYDDFPEPVISRGRCRLWLEADILKWAKQRSRR